MDFESADLAQHRFTGPILSQIWPSVKPLHGPGTLIKLPLELFWVPSETSEWPLEILQRHFQFLAQNQKCLSRISGGHLRTVMASHRFHESQSSSGQTSTSCIQSSLDPKIYMIFSHMEFRTPVGGLYRCDKAPPVQCYF